MSLNGTGGLSALQISHTANFLVIEEIKKNAPDSSEILLHFLFAMRGLQYCAPIEFVL